MIIIFARKLSPPDMEFVDSIFRQDTSYPEIANKVVASLASLFYNSFQMASIMHRAYFLEKLREDDDCFCVFIADFDLKCLFYI
mmetsp:Transcript_4899/g.7283  ORF Transcript_4899/g.7283 Transcript_4899/m.7283 type:complete len:84 (-) Transcript_4899:187-438(-)